MADLPVWAQVVASSGVLGIVAAGANRVWKRLIERPVEVAETRAREAEEKADKADARADYWERKARELTEEVKTAAETARSLRRLYQRESGQRLSDPPPGRNELPTFTAIVDLRQDAVYAVEQERARQKPLNPARGGPLPLDGLAQPGHKSPKDRLPAHAGRQDYDELRLRNARGEIVTPVEFRPRMKTHRDPEPTSPGGWDEESAGMKSPPGSLFPPPGKKR